MLGTGAGAPADRESRVLPAPSQHRLGCESNGLHAIRNSHSRVVIVWGRVAGREALRLRTPSAMALP
jgi:hypothetical protein